MVLTLALFLWAANVNADSLFDLDGDSDSTDTEEDSSDDGLFGDEEEDSSSETEEESESEMGTEPEEKKSADEPQTARIDLTEAAEDMEAEKKLRELTIQDEARLKVVQKKKFFKARRFEMGIGLGLLSGDWDNVMIAGFNMAYHINEYFAVQGRFMYGPFDFEKQTRKQVEEISTYPSSSNLELAGGASAVFSPIYGKISIFGNFIPKYDLNVSTGAYFYRTKTDNGLEEDNNNNFAVQLGLGGRLFITNNFTASLSFDWYMMGDERLPMQGSGGTVSYLKTDFVTTLYVSMFLPFE